MADTEGFGKLLDRYVHRLDPKGRRHQARAVEAWNDVVGEEVRRHTRGLALREGELVVHVDSPSWATELSVLGEHFRKEVNSRMGEELVRAIRFTVSKRVSREREREHREREEEAFYTQDRIEPVKLTDMERRQVEYCARAIADDGLREAVIRAMTKDLEWKKATRMRNEAQGAPEGPETGDYEPE